MVESAARAIKPKNSKPLYSIGQVLAKLKSDFPDLTPSKLRFLEDQQLVTPQRTDSGYRKYTVEDIDRVRLVLILQRDQYLPHKVIRKYLSDLDSGLTPVLPNGALVSAALGQSNKSYTKEDLVLRSGAGISFVTEAIKSGLLPAENLYSDEHLVMLARLLELRKVGIEPRHLRGYKAAADREASLITTALTHLRVKDSSQARAQFDELSRDLAGLLDGIRSTLLAQALDR